MLHFCLQSVQKVIFFFQDSTKLLLQKFGGANSSLFQHCFRTSADCQCSSIMIKEVEVVIPSLLKITCNFHGRIDKPGSPNELLLFSARYGDPHCWCVDNYVYDVLFFFLWNSPVQSNFTKTWSCLNKRQNWFSHRFLFLFQDFVCSCLGADEARTLNRTTRQIIESVHLNEQLLKRNADVISEYLTNGDF